MPADTQARGRIAAAREVDTPGEQSDDGDAGHDRTVVEATLDVQHEQQREDRDRDLPRTPAPPREAARREKERNRERHNERLRQPVHVSGVKRRYERAAVLGEDAVEDGQQAHAGGEPGKDDTRRPAARAAAATEERAGDAGKHRGNYDSALGRRGMERLMRGDLAHDQYADAVDGVLPAADAGGKQEPCRQPLRARPTREQREQDRRYRPHGEEERHRRARVTGEFVERERVVHLRAADG